MSPHIFDSRGEDRRIFAHESYPRIAGITEQRPYRARVVIVVDHELFMSTARFSRPADGAATLLLSAHPVELIYGDPIGTSQVFLAPLRPCPSVELEAATLVAPLLGDSASDGHLKRLATTVTRIGVTALALTPTLTYPAVAVLTLDSVVAGPAPRASLRPVFDELDPIFGGPTFVTCLHFQYSSVELPCWL